MSVVITLQAVPNQSLTIVLDGFVYDMEFKVVSDVMAVTIKRDNVNLISGSRFVAGSPLIPYQYLEQGNFIFVSEGSEIPFFTEFGVTQTLLYYTQSELEAIRSGS